MKRIVVGFDGSDPSHKALERAADIANGAVVAVVCSADVSRLIRDPSGGVSAIDPSGRGSTQRGAGGRSKIPRGPWRRGRLRRGNRKPGRRDHSGGRGIGRGSDRRRHPGPARHEAALLRIREHERRSPRALRRARGALTSVDLDLCYTPAHELARRIRERELSPVEVVEASLARIAEVNPRLNCFCFVYEDEAVGLARDAERAVARGDDVGPLHGVPIAIKDLTPTKGKRTTMGSYAFEHFVPEESALIVERLLVAGAIMVGKTTTPEFAYSSFTESPLWGVTRNPWDTGRTPGGSSGGSGAAVASGCVPLAEGTDMGGSVRIPAAWCGLVGLKPSYGRIPLDFLPTQFDTIHHFGPLARTVEDARLFLSVAQGPDARDIMSEVPPVDL